MPTTVDPRSTVVTSPMAISVAKVSGATCGRETAKVVLQKLARQLPPHDFDPRHCGSLRGESDRSTMEEFVEMRIRSALGKGLVVRCCPSGNGVTTYCHECRKPVLPGQLTVTATRATAQAESPSSAPAWHSECFICWQCREQLVEQIYFWSQDGATLYCGRHHAEILRPRCAACDEIIFADECTEADGQFWHIDHFRCTECELPLAGQRYVLAGGDNGDVSRQPYCSRCYHAVHADFCLTCGHIVEAGQRQVTLKGTGCWHADGDCFRCEYCRKPLLGQPFVLRDCLVNSGASNGNDLFCSDVCCFRQLQNEVQLLVKSKADWSSEKGSVRTSKETVMSSEAERISASSNDEEEVVSESSCVYLVRSPLTGTHITASTVKNRSDIKRRQNDLEKSSSRTCTDGEPRDLHDDEELFGRPPNEKISKSENVSRRSIIVTDKFFSASRVTSV